MIDRSARRSGGRAGPGGQPRRRRSRPLQVSTWSRSSGARLPGRPCNAPNSCRASIEQDVPDVRAVTEQKVTRMLTFVAARQPEVTEHFHGLMIDRGAFDRMLAHEAALERRRLPLRRDGVVDRRRRDGNDVRRRPLAAACPDRRRRAALARRCGDRCGQPRSRRYPASHSTA